MRPSRRPPCGMAVAAMCRLPAAGRQAFELAVASLFLIELKELRIVASDREVTKIHRHDPASPVIFISHQKVVPAPVNVLHVRRERSGEWQS
ncbi:hypothetical protein C8J31_10386 [Rhizobium sp. PP-CC-2G-626]|nr:hypothetical protein C8J31_10386 [Rhizobium sp. PP-CC-2G-626]